MLDKKAVFINTASQVIVRFVTLAFTLVSIKLLTNYLGTSGVGEYNTITTYVNFFIVIADLGLFAVLVREISKDPDNEKKIISNAFTIRLVTALAAALLSILIVVFTKYDPNIKFGVMIAAGFLFFNLLSSLYDVVLQFRLKMQFSATAEFLSKLLTLTALYLIIRYHGNFYWVISTITISGLLVFFFKYIFASRFIKFVPKYDKKIVAWILNMAWPLGLVFIVNNLFFKLDTLMLFAIKGAAPVGIYSVAYKILEVTAFVPGYFASALKPTIAKNIDSGSKPLGSIISKSIILMLILVSPLTATFIAFSKDIILFLSNPEFVSGSIALIILSLTLPFIFLDVLLGEILIGKDSRKLLLRISIFIVSFNFIVNLIAIPRYSFVGAALTTLLSEMILLIINIYYTKKIIPYTINKVQLFKILAVFSATLAFALIIRTSGLYFIILMILSFVFYGLLSHAFSIFKINKLKEFIS